MNLAHDFPETAEATQSKVRIGAQHCAQLLPPPPPERDLPAAMSALGKDLAQAIGGAIAELNGEGKLTATCGAAAQTTSQSYLEKLGSAATHSVVTLADGAQITMTIGHAVALALTDRAYGGSGAVAEPLPDMLPLSADLTLRKLEAACCEGLGQVIAGAEAPAVIRRGTDLLRLSPFRGKPVCLRMDLTLEQDGLAPWTITLAASAADCERLLSASAGDNAEVAPLRGPADPLGEPFGDVPLPARAVLADVPISVAHLARLAPGDLIPLAIARTVPLTIAGRTVACGTVGTLDDRVALQITRIL